MKTVTSRWRGVPAALASLLLACGTASAGKRISTECQKNLDDGRILVTDGSALPDGATFKVVSYKAARTEDGWSYGPCVVDLR